MAQITALSPERERELQEAALAWARENTTRALATRFLAQLGFKTPS
jgi:hypothetical protein